MRGCLPHCFSKTDPLCVTWRKWMRRPHFLPFSLVLNEQQMRKRKAMWLFSLLLLQLSTDFTLCIYHFKMTPRLPGSPYYKSYFDGTFFCYYNLTSNSIIIMHWPCRDKCVWSQWYYSFYHCLCCCCRTDTRSVEAEFVLPEGQRSGVESLGLSQLSCGCYRNIKNSSSCVYDRRHMWYMRGCEAG